MQQFHNPTTSPVTPRATAKPAAEAATSAQARAALQQQLSQWLSASAAGDQTAFTRFYDQTHRQVYGLLFRILKTAALAEEVLLDVYLQVWRQAGAYEAARGSVLAWLLTIARSRALDRWRASAAQRQESDDLEVVSVTVAATGVSPEESSLLSERSRLVRQALAQLSPEQRLLIETAYFEGLSHQELAEQFALPLGTVKTRIRSGMLVLRKHLNEFV